MRTRLEWKEKEEEEEGEKERRDSIWAVEGAWM